MRVGAAPLLHPRCAHPGWRWQWAPGDGQEGTSWDRGVAGLVPTIPPAPGAGPALLQLRDWGCDALAAQNTTQGGRARQHLGAQRFGVQLRRQQRFQEGCASPFGARDPADDVPPHTPGLIGDLGEMHLVGPCVSQPPSLVGRSLLNMESCQNSALLELKWQPVRQFGFVFSSSTPHKGPRSW